MTIGFSSQATKDEIKAAWMYLEWMTQDENLFPFAWGVEGETYTMVGGTPTPVAGYEGEYKQGFNSNKDYWCVTVESRVVGLSGIEDILKANVPAGLPQDFYEEMLQKYKDQVELYDQGYGIIDPLFAEVIAEEAEYRDSLSSRYIEYRDKLVMCAPDKFDALYEQYSKEYWDEGFGEIVEKRLELYKAGKTSVLPKAK
jgi:putative aldouronate transport system substrate-binding protein